MDVEWKQLHLPILVPSLPEGRKAGLFRERPMKCPVLRRPKESEARE